MLTEVKPQLTPQNAVGAPQAPTRSELSEQFEAGLSAVRRVLETLRDAGGDVAGPIAAVNLCASHSRGALQTYIPRNNKP